MMPNTLDQMDPYPLPEDLNPGPQQVMGHGIAGGLHGTRRGILVSVKKLKKNGITLSKQERAAQAPIVGELLIERVHGRELDYQSIAKVVRFEHYHFPSRQASICNPVVFAADERGMVIQGIEKVEVNGAWASFQQVWLVLFGEAPLEPPP